MGHCSKAGRWANMSLMLRTYVHAAANDRGKRRKS
ncbi:hypothetical protein MAXJ12_21864 [Mesorhizobium alhagi CCNWXJ12-2]|uniref:Uncharacterized protein n=1 Tax=Mesorhizobium alhagi CCNWXJ12-2 TaxID=1107882 RepID=H0HW15_9HYPH|nr:hypothetical protein MAXJ12_21864 [Mesorhizobium alhagi CCNWXJ12-2]